MSDVAEEAVTPVLDVADLVADDADSDAEKVLKTALGRVRKRGAHNE